MGNLYIVATPIGNLGDISKRAIETLKSVDIILCEDTRTSSHLLNSLDIKTKLISYHKFNETTRSTEVIKLLQEGNNIALITDAGTPCISDPGSILIKEVILNNISLYSIPGPSALITALTLTGLEINNFAFYGFLERKNNLQRQQLKTINDNDLDIVIFYESPKRIVETIKNIDLVMHNPYIVVLNELTKKFEKKYYGFTKDVLNNLLENDKHELGEYVIVVSKNKIEQEIKEEISLEGLLIDKVVKDNCTMKDAITKLANEYKEKYSKNDFYKASLNIKKLLK